MAYGTTWPPAPRDDAPQTPLPRTTPTPTKPPQQRACSLVGAGAGLGWLVLVFYERKTLLADWFGLAETNKRTG